MRVLYFVGNLGAGGLERFVTRVSLRAKRASDFEPLVCCLSKRSGIFLEVLQNAGVPVVQAPAEWHRNRRSLRELGSLIQSLGVDLVHTQVNFSLWQQFLATKRGGAQAFCVTERNCYALRGFARARRLLQFHALRAMGGHYTANGHAVADHLARLVRVPARTIGVLPNGVSVEAPRPDTRNRIRASLGWDESVVGIGYVARMAEHKGHSHLLSALSLGKLKGLPLRACLVGDGPERGRLEHEIDRLELRDHVALTGTVTNVYDYMEAFDIVALFSSREGMANVLLEAMAAGKAVIATDIAPNAEVLDRGRAGLLLKDMTPAAILSTFHQLVECPELRESLGAAAQRRVESTYSVDACYENLLAHYSKVLNA